MKLGENMKKNGFTLVELLGVIIILAVISLITIPIVDRSMKESKQKADATQKANIELAAKNWALDYMDKIGGNSISITLGQLKNESYLANDIKVPSTNVAYNDNRVIKINYVNKDYVASLTNTVLDGLINEIDSDYPYITLKGEATVTISMGDTYTDAGAIGFIDEGTTTIASVGTVDTATAGTYYITYTAESSENITSIKRKIIVQ